MPLKKLKRKKLKATKRKKVKRNKGILKSKTKGFLKQLRKNNSMIEYLIRLKIMNPAATLLSSESGNKRDGSYTSLAHANQEFKAPKLSKGKVVEMEKRAKAKKRR